jgi:6-phosphogluconolactonase (cycloisomerase 2 family)
VVNYGSGDVSAYTINATTGVLNQIPCGSVTGCNGSNFTAGASSRSVSVDPTGRFAYVVNYGSGDVSAYTIDATTGALTQIACTGGISACNGNNFLAGTGPISVTTTGKFQ